MRASRFDQFLDEHLASSPRATPRPWSPGPAGAGAAYGFFFAGLPDRTGLPATAGNFAVNAAFCDVDMASLYVEAAKEPAAWRPGHRESDVASTAAPRSERAARVLSPRERVAVAAMEELGATLRPGFTFEDLRHAFRTLALAYHPDRHVDCGQQEKARLGQCFSRARSAYEVLTDVFARVH